MIQDLMEHLRTVHFALVATCLIVIIGASAKTPEIDKRLREQALAVTKVDEALSNWPGDRLGKALRKEIFAELGETFKASAVLLQEKCGLRGDLDVSYPDEITIAVTSDPPVEISDADVQELRKLAAPFQSSVSLEEFANFWNSLSVVITWPDPATLSLEPDGPMLQMLSGNSKKLRLRFVCAEAEQGWLAPVSVIRIHGALSAQGSWPRSEMPITMSFNGSGVRVAALRNSLCHVLIRDLPSVTCLGRLFEKDFRLLAPIIREQGSLEVQDLLVFLDARVKEEPVKVLGLDVPRSELKRYGILGILVLQLYFLLQYRTWMGLRGRGDVLPVAWIGAYTDPLSRASFWLSLTLPTTAILLISESARLVALSGWLVCSLVEPWVTTWRLPWLWLSIIAAVVVIAAGDNGWLVALFGLVALCGITAARWLYIATKPKR